MKIWYYVILHTVRPRDSASDLLCLRAAFPSQGFTNWDFIFHLRKETGYLSLFFSAKRLHKLQVSLVSSRFSCCFFPALGLHCQYPASTWCYGLRKFCQEGKQDGSPQPWKTGLNASCWVPFSPWCWLTFVLSEESSKIWDFPLLWDGTYIQSV